MQKKHFTFPSSDGRTTIHGIRWTPEGKVCGVLQLIHGMAEYIDRYDTFASFMCDQGFAVIGHDQLGHGDSIAEPEDLGFFAETRGKNCLLKDIHRVSWLAKKLYPDVPVFALGHSMGSFLLRRCITIYPDEFAGVIICATGDFIGPEIQFAHRLAQAICRQKGDHYISKLLDDLALGSLRAQFGPGRRPGSWLSANAENAAAYAADPMCGYPLTAGGYRDFFELLVDLVEERDFDNINKDLPIFMISGMEDALGGFTQKVLNVYNRFIEMDMTDMDIYFYEGNRHEILQEKDKETVFEDILLWIEKHMEV